LRGENEPLSYAGASGESVEPLLVRKLPDLQIEREPQKQLTWDPMAPCLQIANIAERREKVTVVTMKDC
jgi:hypothetical protein